MEKLRLYEIDADYIKYLYQYDNRVMYWESAGYKTTRKYLGVVLKIHNFSYFAPLSSPKANDYYYKSGERRIKKNTIPIVRLVTDKGVLLGKVKLSNMIPVQAGNITLYDIEHEADTKYKNLITKEIICIRKSRKEILRNARVLYNQKVNQYNNINYLNYTVDFKMLETANIRYQTEIPNAETLAVIDDVIHNRNMSKAYDDIDELFKDLES